MEGLDSSAPVLVSRGDQDWSVKAQYEFVGLFSVIFCMLSSFTFPFNGRNPFFKQANTLLQLGAITDRIAMGSAVMQNEPLGTVASDLDTVSHT